MRPLRASPLWGWIFALAALGSIVVGPAHAGRIVVNNDEWPTSDFGFTQAGGTNAQAFSQNLASFLDTDGTAGGNVLIFSGNFGLTGGSFNAALTAAGYIPTVSTLIPFDLPTLSTFDAVFLAGPAPIDFTALSAYVNAGGGVYIAAGTAGFGGNPAAEAAFWNPFLAQFGLQFAEFWDQSTLALIDPVESSHPIFTGVSRLFYDFGNPVLAQLTPNSAVVEFNSAGVGLIGVFDDVAVPEPGGLALLGMGLVGFALLQRRLRR